MKHPSLMMPRQIRLTTTTVGVGRLRLVAHLEGDPTEVTVECPESLEPGVLLVCLAAIEQFIREQTGATPEIQFGTGIVEAL